MLILRVKHHRRMMRYLQYMIILLCATELKAVEILEADPVLSGRLIGPEAVDVAFGR